MTEASTQGYYGRLRHIAEAEAASAKTPEECSKNDLLLKPLPSWGPPVVLPFSPVRRRVRNRATMLPALLKHDSLAPAVTSNSGVSQDRQQRCTQSPAWRPSSPASTPEDLPTTGAHCTPTSEHLRFSSIASLIRCHKPAPPSVSTLTLTPILHQLCNLHLQTKFWPPSTAACIPQPAGNLKASSSRRACVPCFACVAGQCGRQGSSRAHIP
jgi:hypothetical protein